MQGDGGIMMRSDYPEEQGLKEDFVYPWYERERKKREVTSTDEEPPTGKAIFISSIFISLSFYKNIDVRSLET